MNQTNSITQGIIWKQLLVFFFPILLGSFFQQMYNTADTIIVGRAIGTQALAAVGSSSSLINLVSGFFIGLSSGATVVLSQHYGANDMDRVEKALRTGIVLSVVLGILTTLTGILLGPAVLRWIQTPENCMDDAVIYVQIYFSGAVASMVYNMGTGILRAMGDSRRPMYFLLFTCLLNIFMDILLVVVLKLGVAGAAIATVISQCISAVLVLLALRKMPRGGHMKLGLDGAMLSRILAIGIPAGLQFITYDLSNLITQSSINSFGDVTTAAWAAYAKSDAIIWMVLAAFGVSITTFVGQNYGAGRLDRVKRSVWICMAMSTAVTAALSAAEVIFRRQILGIYTTDPAVIRVGTYMMQFAVPFIFLFVPVEIMGGAMRGCGYSLVPALITGSFACVFRVAWVLFVVSRFHDLFVLVVCYPISWLMCAVTFCIVYFRGRWLRGPIPQDAVYFSEK